VTFTEIGALTGFITFVFTVFDRFLSGRPIISIGRNPDYSSGEFRDLICTNVSDYDLLITSIRSWPDWVRVNHDDSVDAAVRSAMRHRFTASLAAKETRRFPIVVHRGELLDDECTERGMFMVMVFWRKPRSAWLPQLPCIVISSARTLRQLAESK
jgi:hypothetical protein